MSHRLGVVLPEPLAYFLTWPTYGTWLPGDNRGWVKRHHGHQLPSPWLELEVAARMTEDACRLDEEQRRLVEQTVADHCRIRGWTLHAVNCRSNHLHVVLSADRHPNDVRKQLKAWTVRRLKRLECQSGTPSRLPHRLREKWWAERGSNRFINDEDSLEAAVVYVRDAQDVARRSDNRQLDMQRKHPFDSAID